MGKAMLAGVSTLEFYDSSTGDLILTSKTMTETAINVTISEQEVRAGKGNGLVASFFHTSGMGITGNDVSWDLSYLALKFGTQIKVGGTAFVTETVTTTLNKISVLGTPVDFHVFGKIGWYKLKTETDEEWKKITFVGKDATATIASGVEVCVKYNAVNDSLKEIEIPANMIPSICYVLMKSDIFRTSESGVIDSNSSKIGTLITEIPQFQFDPNLTLTMSASANSTVPVNGKVLINYSNDCEGGDGYYAKIKEIINGSKWYTDVVNLAVSNPSIDLITGETETIEVYALYKSGAYKKIDNSKFTFVSSTPATATVSAGGLVTFVATGTTNITVTATEKTTLDTIVQVTCS